MKKTPRIAVLGSGIMGGSTALFLARGGADVTLFDAASKPFSAASRWNEGKIHLGFLYSADPSLRTARHVIHGGLAFKPLVEELIGCPLDTATTSADDIYLCHRDSVVRPGAMHDYFRNVADMLRTHPDARRYLVDVSHGRVEGISPGELGAVSDSPDIIAGFRVPERSVSTTWIADRFTGALSSEPRIEQRMNSRVRSVSRQTVNKAERWFVETSSGVDGPFDYIVNALWEGRMAVDQTAGLEPAGKWSNRFRLSLFIRTREPVDVPSAIVVTGPFGDIKNYNNRDFYLSWYPLGLIADSEAIRPAAPAVPDKASGKKLSGAILEKLEELLPQTSRIRERAEHMALRGGWVFAAGQGALSDPESTLHRRSGFGMTRTGSYLSVDTGKYSTAPWLARKVADSIIG